MPDITPRSTWANPHDHSRFGALARVYSTLAEYYACMSVTDIITDAELGGFLRMFGPWRTPHEPVKGPPTLEAYAYGIRVRVDLAHAPKSYRVRVWIPESVANIDAPSSLYDATHDAGEFLPADLLSHIAAAMRMMDYLRLRRLH